MSRKKRKSSAPKRIVRNKSYSSPPNYRIVKVTVAVPARIRSKLARETLIAPPIKQKAKRSKTVRVPLARREKTVIQTVRVAVPRRNRPRPATMMVNPKGWLSIFSRRKTNATLKTENHRKRHDRKSWRMRASTGYLDSTRRDTGLLAANARMSAKRLADAALVNSALGG